MTLVDIKKCLIALMKTSYPDTDYNYYASDVIEGFVRPCFFTKLQVDSCEPINFNTKQVRATFSIAYLQDHIDEVDCLNVAQTLVNSFGLNVNISCASGSDGNVIIDSSDWDFVGTEDNILELNFDLTWYEDIFHGSTNFLAMKDVYTNSNVVDN